MMKYLSLFVFLFFGCNGVLTDDPTPKTGTPEADVSSGCDGIIECLADGCCPESCTEDNDPDCAPGCGNGRVELDETCDGDCSPDCDDNSECTQDSMRGSPETCDVVCEHVETDICQSGDGCCPSGCLPNTDDDCQLDCSNPDSWPSNWGSFEMQVVTEINRVRAQGADCGQFGAFAPTGAVEMDTNLQQAARCHSDDMATNNFFDHAGSNGSSFGQRIQNAGFQGQPAGENIAAGQRNPESAVASWVESDGHCQNLMNPDANKIGLGFVSRSGTQWTNYWTMVTGRN